ncbi:TolC family protein [Clostridium ljungdahlii]|uniref:Outer membrane efflux protein n=1 Tax=Clostridium ljungdahlii TaxID=1538 RepID=A0A168NU06_9CLOT|nr:TolC family protein [Clostridium ljungdahlii]OAA86900.1 Outer membrane efflux protein [Clostridium ljungdahlii]
MKKVSSTIIILFLAVVFNSGAVFAKNNSLDIDAALDSTIKNSYDLKMEDYSVQSDQNVCDQAKDAANDANTKLVMNQNMLDLRSKPNKTPEEEAMLANFVPLTDDQIYQLIKIRDVQPLEAQYELTTAQNNKESIENSVKLNLYTQYIKLLSDQDSIDTEQKNIKKLYDVYTTSKLKLNLGTITQLECKKNAASYNNENLTLSKIQRSMNIDEMNINKTMGQDIKAEYVSFSTKLPDYTTDNRSVSDYLDLALKNRSEILNCSEYVKLKQKSYDIASERYPDESNINNKQAKYDLDAAENNLEIEKITIQKDVTNEYNTLINKKSKIDSAMQNYNMAKKNYDIASKKYEVGVISRIDFEDSELTYRKAVDNVSSLKRDYWLEQFKMNCEVNKGFSTSTGLSSY